MTTFVPPQRMEPPRQRVLITQVDTVNLTAVGSNLSNRGKINIDLSVHSGQTVIYPRENEEWLITKVNESWILDKKAGFGNEGLLREANPGDLVTVTTGDYYLDAGSAEIACDTTVDGHLTANSDFTVWGNTDIGPIQIYGRLDLLGDIHMNHYNFYTDGGFIHTDNGTIDAGATGQIWGGQIVGRENSFFNKYLQANTMQVIGNCTTGEIDNYGVLRNHGWNIDLQGGSVLAAGLYGNGLEVYGGYIHGGGGNIGGIDLATNGVFPNGRGVWGAGTVDAAAHVSGGAGFNGGGFRVGAGGVDGGGCFGDSASFGGMLFNGNGINTGWRTVDAGFGWMWAGAFITNVSEAQFKQDISPVEISQLDLVVNAPVYQYRYNPDAIDPDQNDAPERSMSTNITATTDTTSAEPSINDVSVTDDSTSSEDFASVPTEIIAEVTDTWRVGPMVEDLPDQVVRETSRGKAPELTAMVNTAWGAIQELSKKLDEANQKIASLTTRLEAVGG